MPATDDLAAAARRAGSLGWAAAGPGVRLPAPAGAGRWAAAVVDAAWHDLGRPDPFVAVVDGVDPDPATMACRASLRLLRVTGPGTTPATDVLGPLTAPADPDDEPAHAAGIGPLVADVAAAPTGLATAVVVAVGALGALAADRFEWRRGAWSELRLVAGRQAGTVDEVALPADPARTRHFPRPGADGARMADPAPAARWVAAARTVAASGWVVVADRPDLLVLRRPSGPPWAAGSVGPLVVASWPMRTRGSV